MQSQTSQCFDYIVVGAGSAGAVLASRLSDDADVSVCLVEAGPEDRHPLISIPLGLIWLAKDKRHNWLYRTTPQAALNGRVVSVPRGKVLGGSSAINGMIYIRGHRDDYDGWAALGCTGWDYDSVLPFFKRSEANTDETLSDAFHGREGPLSVTPLPQPNPMDKVFIDAAGELQFRHCADFNTPEPDGVGVYQVTQRAGRRHSTAAAFLAPVRHRANLTILTNAEVSRVVFDGLRATGVVLRRNDRDETLLARGEIILSAGTIGSPDLLLRSGVGPGQSLQAAGLPVVVDLPGVGCNLQDHVDAMVICRSQSITPYGVSARAVPRLMLDGMRWLASQRGMLSSNMVEAGGFARTSPQEARPDIQFHFIPGRKSHRGRMIEYGHGVSLHSCLLRPRSRGSVTRNSPDGPPAIDLGLLNDADDVARLAKGVQLARRILAQTPFRRHGLTEIVPGPAVQDTDALQTELRAIARTVYHPVGTCAMGRGPDAVTTPELAVHGVKGLRVVDASIMPRIVSGNTNAPAIMIAEKAARMIREDRITAAVSR